MSRSIYNIRSLLNLSTKSCHINCTESINSSIPLNFLHSRLPPSSVPSRALLFITIQSVYPRNTTQNNAIVIEAHCLWNFPQAEHLRKVPISNSVTAFSCQEGVLLNLITLNSYLIIEKIQTDVNFKLKFPRNYFPALAFPIYWSIGNDGPGDGGFPLRNGVI